MSLALKTELCKPTDAPMVAGKYRIEELIASGGMGLVYRAWQPLIARHVAVKIVRPELMRHQDTEARFLTEARVLAQLETEHACRVLDGGKLDDGTPYMVLEYLEGADLRTVLNDAGRLDVTRCVDLVLQLLEPLAEMHAMGMVHRDIKPENLFVTRTKGRGESMKLLDFGICGERSDLRASADENEEIMGSPQYIPPEHLGSPSIVDERGDIWSVGVVLYELLTGKVPFDGDQLTAIYAQILARPAPSLCELRPDAPVELDLIIRRCLAKELDERYPNVGELAAALAPLGSDGNRISVERVRNTLQPPSVRDAKRQAPPPSVALPRRTSTTVVKPKSPRAFPRLAVALLAGALLGAVSTRQSSELSHLPAIASKTWSAAPEPMRAFVASTRNDFAAAIDHYAARVPPELRRAGDSLWGPSAPGP
jgi:serine/threonine-protein kinase